MPGHGVVHQCRGRRSRALLLGGTEIVDVAVGGVGAVACARAPRLGEERIAARAGRDREAAVDLLLNELGAVLKSLIVVLLEDGGMVLMGHLATIEDHADEVFELAPGVARVVNVGGRLRRSELARLIQHVWGPAEGGKCIPRLPFAAEGGTDSEHQRQ